MEPPEGQSGPCRFLEVLDPLCLPCPFLPFQDPAIPPVPLFFYIHLSTIQSGGAVRNWLLSLSPSTASASTPRLLGCLQLVPSCMLGVVRAGNLGRRLTGLSGPAHPSPLPSPSHSTGSRARGSGARRAGARRVAWAFRAATRSPGRQTSRRPRLTQKKQ